MNTKQGLEIDRVDNGYLASWWVYNGEAIKHQMCFMEENKEHGEIECFQRLLYFITEHFGMIGSKHDARRIRIITGEEDENL